MLVGRNTLIGCMAMATRSHGLKWVITGLLFSILKFPQVSPNGFLSSMTHQRLLFEPILNLGVWQMGLSIPCSVCIQFIILCSFYTVHSPSSWSKQILYANPSVEKKSKAQFRRVHIWWSNNWKQVVAKDPKALKTSPNISQPVLFFHCS